MRCCAPECPRDESIRSIAHANPIACLCRQDSELTGDMIKVGEVFEATEAVPPSDSTGLGYLRVGDRGWVFDMGIAGPWIGVPVVAAVTGPNAMKYAQILRNPAQYAEYQAALGDEIFLDEDQPEGPSNERNDALWQDLQQDIEDTGLLTEDEQQSFESLCQDEEERNLVLSSLRAAAGEAFRKLVVPRWMKLAQLLPPEMKREMEATRQLYGALPGCSNYKLRPNDTGRRIGLRVPSACTAA
ncbi:nipblb [Symbiodinium microadriaticum]|nr:nipblb [Symbiodinium microadriaticum]